MGVIKREAKNALFLNILNKAPKAIKYVASVNESVRSFFVLSSVLSLVCLRKGNQLVAYTTAFTVNRGFIKF